MNNELFFFPRLLKIPKPRWSSFYYCHVHTKVYLLKTRQKIGCLGNCSCAHQPSISYWRFIRIPMVLRVFSAMFKRGKNPVLPIHSATALTSIRRPWTLPCLPRANCGVHPKFKFVCQSKNCHSIRVRWTVMLPLMSLVLLMFVMLIEVIFVVLDHYSFRSAMAETAEVAINKHCQAMSRLDQLQWTVLHDKHYRPPNEITRLVGAFSLLCWYSCRLKCMSFTLD